MRRLTILALGAVLLASAATAAEVVFSATAGWQRDPSAAPGAYTLAVTITVQDGWHVNSHAPLSEDLIATTVQIDAPAGWQVGAPAFPPHRKARFEFSEEPVAVHEGTFVVRIPVTIPTDAAADRRDQGHGPRPGVQRPRVPAPGRRHVLRGPSGCRRRRGGRGRRARGHELRARA